MSKIQDYLDELVLPETFQYDLTENKKTIFRAYCLDMLSRTLGMFEYSGLPETLSARSMEIQMQTCGYCVIAKIPNPAHGKSGLYCFRVASPSGELNAEKLPTRMVVNDTWTNFNEELVIDEDCIVIANDPLWLGIGNIFALHAGQLTDAETTMRLQLYNARTNKILTATDDKVVESAKQILNDLIAGKWGVIGDAIELEGMMKALSSIDFTSPHAGTIKDTMEVLQYYRAQWFIALGLNDNFNMKRESLNENETESNENTLFTLPLMMLKYREEGVKKLNEKYGLNVSVKFGSVWETAYKKYLLSLEIRKAETEQVKQATENQTEETPEDKPEDKPEEQPQEEQPNE